MDKQYVIKTTGLTYHYSKDAKTLSEINLQVERGSVYGFLGPNGSGKTTTLSLLLGLLNNQQGDIEIFGQHLHANRIDILRKVGSLIETPSLYGHLTAKENLEVYRAVYSAPKEKIAEVLKVVGLDTGKKVVKKFSLGMKQRLSIALALLPSPELLVLDEPSNGLDPAGIIELREFFEVADKIICRLVFFQKKIEVVRGRSHFNTPRDQFLGPFNNPHQHFFSGHHRFMQVHLPVHQAA